MHLLEEMFAKFINTDTRNARAAILHNYLLNNKEALIKDYLIGYNYILERKYRFAWKIFKNIEQESDITKWVKMAQGFICLNMGKEAKSRASLCYYKRATRFFKDSLSKDPANVYAILGRGSVLYHEAETKKIYEIEGRLTNSKPEDSPRVLNELAKAELNKAIPILEKKQNTVEVVFPILWNRLGDVSLQLGDLENARDAYDKALKQSNAYAYAVNGLGRVLKAELKWELAIPIFRRAHNLSNEFKSNFNFPLIYLGDCYLTLGQFDKADECYRQVLHLEGVKYDENGKVIFRGGLAKRKLVTFALLGLGRINYELGKKIGSRSFYENAQYFYDQAQTISKGYAYIYLHYGRLLARMGDIEGAIRKLEEAKKLFDKTAMFSRIGDITENINQLNKMINIKNKRQKQKYKYNKQVTVLDEIVTSIYPAAFSNTKRNFFEFLSEDPTIDDEKAIKNEFTLEVLRKWNSYTPLINSSIGGGYFINFYGDGLVVDPGYNFAHNFRLAEHKFYEINNIWISHAHDDHTADLEPIFNLLYRYNKNLLEEYIALRYARSQQKPKSQVLKIIDQRIDDKIKKIVKKAPPDVWDLLLDDYSKRRKEIKLMGCHEVMMKFEGLAEVNKLTEKDDKQFVLIERKDITPLSEIEIEKSKRLVLHHIKGQHDTYLKNEACKGNNSFGFYINYQNTALVYTGDTRWDEDVRQEYIKVKKAIKGVDNRILIAHYGAFRDNELDFLDRKEPKYIKAFYKNHLGALGLVEINMLLRPQLCIISEFGEEYSGLRAKIASVYNKAFDNPDEVERTYFLPADIGLKVRFDYPDDDDPIRIWAITNVDHFSRKIEYGYLCTYEVGYQEIQGLSCIIYFNRKTIKKTDLLDAVYNRYTGTQSYYYISGC